MSDQLAYHVFFRYLFFAWITDSMLCLQTAETLPGKIVRHVSAEDGGLADRWPADLIQSLFQTLQKVLRAVPPAAPALLSSAAALAAAAPSAVKVCSTIKS